ncbi:hypothetical protein EDC01DRAFT_410538 [Geopyxis carbonaria]|nr:hypothetical protein EDC01DRAFT_410538 [Geopyxis carbonaria]
MGSERVACLSCRLVRLLSTPSPQCKLPSSQAPTSPSNNVTKLPAPPHPASCLMSHISLRLTPSHAHAHATPARTEHSTPVHGKLERTWAPGPAVAHSPQPTRHTPLLPTTFRPRRRRERVQSARRSTAPPTRPSTTTTAVLRAERAQGEDRRTPHRPAAKVTYSTALHNLNSPRREKANPARCSRRPPRSISAAPRSTPLLRPYTHTSPSKSVLYILRVQPALHVHCTDPINATTSYRAPARRQSRASTCSAGGPRRRRAIYEGPPLRCALGLSGSQLVFSVCPRHGGATWTVCAVGILGIATYRSW